MRRYVTLTRKQPRNNRIQLYEAPFFGRVPFLLIPVKSRGIGNVGKVVGFVGEN